VLAFVMLGLVSSVLSQEIGGEECLQNDRFCVAWDVKPWPRACNSLVDFGAV